MGSTQERSLWVSFVWWLGPPWIAPGPTCVWEFLPAEILPAWSFIILDRITKGCQIFTILQNGPIELSGCKHSPPWKRKKDPECGLAFDRTVSPTTGTDGTSPKGGLVFSSVPEGRATASDSEGQATTLLGQGVGSTVMGPEDRSWN